MSYSEQEKVRREKLKKIIALGINPYPPELFSVSHLSTVIKENFESGKKVSVAGRIMSRRIQGKASFAELQDSEGKIQLYFNRDELCKSEDKSLYNEVYKKLLDIGDIIGVTGILFKTQVGEKTIQVEDFKILSKSIRPIPIPKTDSEGNIYDEFKDPELRYRQRYVDLILNPVVKKTFIKRTKITNSIRDFFNAKGYLEVETPVLQPIPGGAQARPFITHHNALDIPLYLRIANELYLKRLIVGGMDGVYEFSKDFRNEGMDKSHNPEFTVMELYVAYKDYFWMMETTEKLLDKICNDVNHSSKVIFANEEIDFKPPYPRVPIYEAINEYTNLDISNMDVIELSEAAKSLGIEIDNSMGKGKIIDAIFGEKCEHHFIQPTFIIDYPKEMSPLTKQHRKEPKLTERFELIVNGSELANAYSELNDPIDQRARFEEQLELSKKGDDEAMFIDHDFLRALEYGMPPTSGIGIGIDRLTMLLTNNTSIQEVIFFPQMRPEKKIQLDKEEEEVLSFLNPNTKIDINEVRRKSSLSNKKWDLAIKNLRKKSLIEIKKENNTIFIISL